jgi:nucleoside-diphosphate-sugar epimerase
MKVLVTGASGFVGGAFLARAAREHGMTLRAALRGAQPVPEDVEAVFIEGLARTAAWGDALNRCDAVVHTAARAHVMDDTAEDLLEEFRRVNVEGTLNLARQAAHLGVRRFVFISSIKVNGARTMPGAPFTTQDVPAPCDAYAISKLEAEQGLSELGRETGMEVVIIRPVLVYGPGVKANFRSMMRWLRRGIPLPFGAVDNRRSLVAVENLTDLMLCCLRHSAAANQTFLISDGEDLSTPALLQRTAAAMNVSARLLPIPPRALRTAARFLGQEAVAQRLCDSLQVDMTDTCALLAWKPPVGIDEALARTVGHFLASERGGAVT